MDKDVIFENLEFLCGEIIKTACKEYRDAYKKKDKSRLIALERYFYGPDFEMQSLGDIDPHSLLAEIRRQVDSGEKQRRIQGKMTGRG